MYVYIYIHIYMYLYMYIDMYSKSLNTHIYFAYEPLLPIKTTNTSLYLASPTFGFVWYTIRKTKTNTSNKYIQTHIQLNFYCFVFYWYKWQNICCKETIHTYIHTYCMCSYTLLARSLLASRLSSSLLYVAAVVFVFLIILFFIKKYFFVKSFWKKIFIFYTDLDTYAPLCPPIVSSAYLFVCLYVDMYVSNWSAASNWVKHFCLV